MKPYFRWEMEMDEPNTTEPAGGAYYDKRMAEQQQQRMKINALADSALNGSGVYRPTPLQAAQKTEASLAIKLDDQREFVNLAQRYDSDGKLLRYFVLACKLGYARF